MGAPSTGKTTIASQLAKEYNTVWMPEYGREYWEKRTTCRYANTRPIFRAGRNPTRWIIYFLEVPKQHLFFANQCKY
ncbi:AAA family ATPase [Nostoc sp. NOS(2021)]|uniref:AAA family ATPase n=1 Tax=Nostoc sp. NOS(2021) TaxID=2815407 RepID=UPI0025EB2076|nr:AAA family ATPase [Nostoc sp. NOS(2021)]